MSVTLETRVARLESELAVVKAELASVAAGRTSAATLPTVNIDDPKYGDPVIRKDPPRWKGKTHEGAHYSQCPPEYLRELSGFLVWRAGKENEQPEKQKYAKYSMLDAARAIEWAKRKETEASRYGTSGRGASAKHSVPRDDFDDSAEAEADAFGGTDDDSIPF